MANLSGIMQQLKKERDRVERELSGLNAAIAAFVNVYAETKPKRRQVSAKSRAKMAAAQKARYARARKESQPKAEARPTTLAPAKRVMSPAARKKIAAAQRARWAKARASQR